MACFESGEQTYKARDPRQGPPENATFRHFLSPVLDMVGKADWVDIYPIVSSSVWKINSMLVAWLYNVKQL